MLPICDQLFPALLVGSAPDGAKSPRRITVHRGRSAQCSRPMGAKGEVTVLKYITLTKK